MYSCYCSHLQLVPATRSAPCPSVTPPAGSARVSPGSAAPAVTAACWDTGGSTNTAAVRATARGAATPSPATASPGESRVLNTQPCGAFWVFPTPSGAPPSDHLSPLRHAAQTPQVQPEAARDTAAIAARRRRSGQRSSSLHCTTPVSHRPYSA